MQIRPILQCIVGREINQKMLKTFNTVFVNFVLKFFGTTQLNKIVYLEHF